MSSSQLCRSVYQTRTRFSSRIQSHETQGSRSKTESIAPEEFLVHCRPRLDLVSWIFLVWALQQISYQVKYRYKSRSRNNGSIRKNWSWTLPVGSCEKVYIKNQWGRREIQKIWISRSPHWFFMYYFLARSYGVRPRPIYPYTPIIFSCPIAG